MRCADGGSDGDGGGRGGDRRIENLIRKGAGMLTLADGDQRRSKKGWNMPWWVSLQRPKGDGWGRPTHATGEACGAPTEISAEDTEAAEDVDG